MALRLIEMLAQKKGQRGSLRVSREQKAFEHRQGAVHRKPLDPGNSHGLPAAVSIINQGWMRRLINPIRDNSLSIVLFALFVICISVQSFAGWRVLNETLAVHGQAQISYRHFLLTGVFWEGLSSNWQAAVLQLGSLIVFSSFLYQRGAPHSLDPRKAKQQQGWLKSGRFTWVYRHSLFLAFLLLFILTLVLHFISGTNAYNEERAFTGQPPVSIAAFMLSAKFWSTTLQTWQAEYLVIALYVVLTIFLRQEDSPESKPVDSENATTGEANK